MVASLIRQEEQNHGVTQRIANSPKLSPAKKN